MLMLVLHALYINRSVDFGLTSKTNRRTAIREKRVWLATCQNEGVFTTKRR
jgi:hypothetical protein